MIPRRQSGNMFREARQAAHGHALTDDRAGFSTCFPVSAPQTSGPPLSRWDDGRLHPSHSLDKQRGGLARGLGPGCRWPVPSLEPGPEQLRWDSTRGQEQS